MRVASGGRAALLRPGLLRALVLGASSWRLARVAQDREHGAAGARHPAACRCQDWVASLTLFICGGHAAWRPELQSTEAGGGVRAAACICNLPLRNSALTKTTRQVGKVKLHNLLLVQLSCEF